MPPSAQGPDGRPRPTGAEAPRPTADATADSTADRTAPDEVEVLARAGDRPGYLPVRVGYDDPDSLEDERISDVNEWGRSEHMRELARKLYDPVYRNWFRVEWEGLERSPPTAGRCWWPTTRRPSRRTRR